MNRIGMKQQAGATKIIPLRKFLESKYQGGTDAVPMHVETQEVQLARWDPTQVASFGPPQGEHIIAANTAAEQTP